MIRQLAHTLGLLPNDLDIFLPPKSGQQGRHRAPTRDQAPDWSDQEIHYLRVELASARVARLRRQAGITP